MSWPGGHQCVPLCRAICILDVTKWALAMIWLITSCSANGSDDGIRSLPTRQHLQQLQRWQRRHRRREESRWGGARSGGHHGWQGGRRSRRRLCCRWGLQGRGWERRPHRRGRGRRGRRGWRWERVRRGRRSRLHRGRWRRSRSGHRLVQRRHGWGKRRQAGQGGRAWRRDRRRRWRGWWRQWKWRWWRRRWRRRKRVRRRRWRRRRRHWRALASAIALAWLARGTSRWRCISGCIVCKMLVMPPNDVECPEHLLEGIHCLTGGTNVLAEQS